jgi:hypothetical protein
VSEVDQWTMADVATHLGITADSVRRYRVRDASFPAPDGQLGRTPWWWPDTIKEWQSVRPGRIGRPRIKDVGQ